MTGLELRWSGPDVLPVEGTCLICSERGPRMPVVAVPNPYFPGELLQFVRCRRCGSLNTIGHLFEFTSKGIIETALHQHYLDIGAGIDFMVRALERARGQRAAPSLLDVGCGFGFTLDYWHRTTGAKVAGVEPSRCGEMGRDILALPVDVACLEEADTVRGRRFGLVLSSEVIEHVQEPIAFIRILRSHLESDGVLVLTTPNADFVRPENLTVSLLASLSPGLHKSLFSAGALDYALRQAQFAHVQVEQRSERLVAFASDLPLTIPPASSSISARYVDYLRSVVDDREVSDAVRLGLLFRLTKELVNCGRTGEAHTYEQRFTDVVARMYALKLDDPAAVRTAMLSSSTLDGYGRFAPYCLGPFLYYRAMRERVSSRDALRAAELFSLSWDVLEHEVRVLTPVHAQEAAALLWRARFEFGSALLVAERREEAITVFDGIMGLHEPEAKEARLVAPPPDILVRTTFQRAIALLQLGRYGEAIMGFGRLLADASAEHSLKRQARELVEQACTDLRARESSRDQQRG